MLRVVNAVVRLNSSGKTMVSILHVDLISCRYVQVLCASEVASVTRTWQYGDESEDDQSQTLIGLAY